MLESRYDVPYFCPKCGRDKTNFDSLAALRYHVDVFHFKNTRNLPPSGYKDPGPLPKDWPSDEMRAFLLNHNPLNFDINVHGWNGLPGQNQTPWSGQENLISRTTSTYSTAAAARPDSGVSNDVNQTLMHLEDLRKSSDRAMAGQREKLKRLEEKVKSKENKLDKTKLEMEKALEEKRNLERECHEMRRNRVEDQGKLETIAKNIDEKDQLIDKKEKELKKLHDFIKNAGQQETEARKKLEETIEKILLRAEKAEAELEQLRIKNMQQASTSSQSQQADMGQSKGLPKNRSDEVRDVIAGTNLASAAAFAHSAEIISNVESLPPEHRQAAAAEAIDEIESQDLSPLAQQYIKNFLAYYRALRQSELGKDSRRTDHTGQHSEIQPMVFSDLDHSNVHSSRQNPEMPQQDRRIIIETPLHPYDYPLVRSQYPMEYAPREGVDRQTDGPRYYRYEGGVQPQRASEDWVMRSENSGSVMGAPFREKSWNPVDQDEVLRKEVYAKNTNGHKDLDLELDSRGIIWDGEPRKTKYPDVGKKSGRGSHKRRPKTDPGFGSGFLNEKNFEATRPASSLDDSDQVPSRLIEHIRRDGEGSLDEHRGPEAGGRRVKEPNRFRIAESSLERRRSDVSETLTEVTKYSDDDDDGGSSVVPERDGSIRRGQMRQMGEGSTGESREDNPAGQKNEATQMKEVSDVVKKTTMKPVSSMKPGNDRESQSDAPVPQPRSKPQQDPDDGTSGVE